MKNFFQHLGGHFKRDSQELPDDAIEGFLRVLEQVRLEDMSCTQAFARLDEFVEKELHGEDAERLMPLLREHLDICSDCCDEYETLLDMLAKSSRE